MMRFIWLILTVVLKSSAWFGWARIRHLWFCTSSVWKIGASIVFRWLSVWRRLWLEKCDVQRCGRLLQMFVLGRNVFMVLLILLWFLAWDVFGHLFQFGGRIINWASVYTKELNFLTSGILMITARVPGTGGCRYSTRLSRDSFVKRCTCVLYRYVSDTIKLSHVCLCSAT